MPEIGGILNIGRRALATHQRAISVLSHNIANVSTPGYTRQEAIYRSAHPTEGLIGTGVELQTVRRVVDRFLEAQIVFEKAAFMRLDIEKSMLDRIEATFHDTNDEGIHRAIGDFFSAAQDLANDPSDPAARIVLMERGDRLAQRIRVQDQAFKVLRQDADTEIRERVNEVNALAKQIADLNLQIRRAENGGQGAHDLRDERTRLINELSETVDIRLLNVEGPDANVIIGRGSHTAPLVMEDYAYSLAITQDPDNAGLAGIFGGTENAVDLTQALTGGKIGGLLQIRDHSLSEAIAQLDKLAASLVNEVNIQHRLGFGLDGSTGNDFFQPLAPVVVPFSKNRGNATVTVQVAPPPLPAEDPNFDPNLDPNLAAPPLLPDPLQFDPYALSFTGGQLLLRNLTTGTFSDTIDFVVTPDGEEATQITFEGMEVTIVGAMEEGDRINISFHEGAAGLMGVALSDKDKIAASGSAEGLPGNNTNALALAQLQDKAVLALENEGGTFQGFYASFVGEVGMQVQQAGKNLSVEEATQERLNTLREEISGVSLDEEMTQLIQFQRAYQASARLVTTADTLLETVIGLKQ